MLVSDGSSQACKSPMGNVSYRGACPFPMGIRSGMSFSDEACQGTPMSLQSGILVSDEAR